MTALRAIIAAGLVGQSFAAELPVIRLDTIAPPSGKAGTEVTAAITGADLDEPKALLFSHPGITGEPKDKGFLIKIAADVPPGIYDVRASGLLGISNPRAFVVGDLPHVTKPAANNTPAAAIELAVDSTVTGNVTAGAADFFKFTAKKGQRIIVDCDAREIDSRLKPVIAAIDAAGSEVEASRREGLLDLTVPSDGAYVIKLHDLTFAGGPEYFYRLTLTTGPHLDFVFPPYGAAGTKGKFTLYGRNIPGGTAANITALDGKPLEKLDVEIDIPTTANTRMDGLASPAAASVPGFSYRLKSPQTSSAVFIGFSGSPVVSEQEPNNDAGHAQKLTPPCEVAGQFFPAADVDTFTFDAKKGDVWWIEVTSNRLDLPTNPFLVIKRDTADVQEAYGADTNIGGARFSTASNDPSVRFEAKEDGTYRISMRDLFGGARKDPRNVYRLAIRKESPDFRLAAITEPRLEKADDRTAAPRSSLLRADGTTAIKVMAFRRDGFAGEIELRAEGLPPGVSCAPMKLAAGANEGVLLLTSAEKPERWAGAIRIFGKAKIGEAEVSREARGGAVRWAVADSNNDVIRPRLTRDIPLAVGSAEPAPISVTVAEDKRWEVVAGAKLDIPLKIARRGEFKEALKLKAGGAPGIDPLKEFDAAPDAATVTASLDLAVAKIPVGEHTIYFSAQTKGKFRGKDVITTIYSTPVRLAVQAPPPPPPAPPVVAPAAPAAPAQTPAPPK